MFESADLNQSDFALWGWIKGLSSEKKGGHTRCVASSHFGRCCPHKEKRRSNQASNNTPSSHTSCKMRWGLRWDLRAYIVKS